MVLVNDFGELAIDADLIEAQDGDMLTLANGCVCCSMGGDFYNALVDVLDRNKRPDHLVIEASGVARPARIADLARAESDLELDGIVTVVDAENFLPRLSDDLVADSMTEQLAAADLILVNKADLVSEETIAALKARLRSINATPPMMTCISGAVPVDTVLGGGTSFRDTNRVPTRHHEHEDGYRRWAHESPGRFDLERLKQALRAFPDSVLRVKGVVFVSDQPEPLAVHRVGPRITVSNAPASLAGCKTSRFVAIAHRTGFDAELLSRLVEGARVTFRGDQGSAARGPSSPS